MSTTSENKNLLPSTEESSKVTRQGGFNYDEEEWKTQKDDATNPQPMEKPLAFSQADNFSIKTKIFEVIEELKMRRELHAEAEEKVQQLLHSNLNLQKLVDAEKELNINETDKHNMQINEMKKKFNADMLSLKEDKEKQVQLAEMAEKEVLKLRDEIRDMLLNKYSLEKRIQELERAIDLQNSSRSSHHRKLMDLELKCKQINVQRTELEEMFEQFKKNVESACELNRKLEYISEHRQCQIEELKQKVDRQYGDLMEVRAKLESRPSPGTELSKMKSQENTFRKELLAKNKLCDQLLKHVEEIRNEHKKTLASLSEAHSLIDHYVKLKELSEVNEVKYQHLLNDHEVLKDSWEEKNKLCQSLQQLLDDKHEYCLKKEEELNASVLAYQSKCDDLRKSSDKLEEIKDHYSRMYKESQLSFKTLQNSNGKSSILPTKLQATQTQPTDDLLSAHSATNSNEYYLQNDINIKQSVKVLPAENIDNVPCLMDRIENTSPDLVSYYITVNNENNRESDQIKNTVKNIDEADKVGHPVEDIKSGPVEDDKNAHATKQNKSIVPTNNKTSIAELSNTLPVICNADVPGEIPQAMQEMRKDNGKYEAEVYVKDGASTCVSTLHAPVVQSSGSDIVVSLTSESSQRNDCDVKEMLIDTSAIPEESEPVHNKEVSVKNTVMKNLQTSNVKPGKCENMKLKRKLFSVVSATNRSHALNFRPMESDDDLVASCQSARIDLDLISQQWEEEKRSQKTTQDHQRKFKAAGNLNRSQQCVEQSGDSSNEKSLEGEPMSPKFSANHPAAYQMTENSSNGNQLIQQSKTENVLQSIQGSHLMPVKTAGTGSKKNQIIQNQLHDKYSQFFPTEVTSQEGSGRRLSFETARSMENPSFSSTTINPTIQSPQMTELKRINSQFIEFPLDQKKPRLDTNDEEGSNIRIESKSTLSGSTQVQVLCSQTPLFSDDEEDDGLISRKDVADQISHIASLPD